MVITIWRIETVFVNEKLACPTMDAQNKKYVAEASN